jgi:hypothetical protein
MTGVNTGTVQTIFCRYFANRWVYETATGKLEALHYRGFIAASGDCQLPEMIELLVEAIPNTKAGFKLSFADQFFPGCQAALIWLQEEADGDWYAWQERGLKAWLGKGMYQYFAAPPPILYVGTASAD